MLILGIESSCDETAASVARDHTEILSNVVSSQVEEHKQYGGVVPEIASRRHCENVLPVVQKALDDAGVTLAELDGIAVTAYPGLIRGTAGGRELRQGTGTDRRKAPCADASSGRAHCGELHCTSGTEAALSLSGRQRRAQSSGGSADLYEIPDSWDGRGTMPQGSASTSVPVLWAIRIPGGIHLDKASQSGQPESIFSAKTENCGKCL